MPYIPNCVAWQRLYVKALVGLDDATDVQAGTPVTPWGEQPSAPCSAKAAAADAKKLFLRPRVPKGAGVDGNSDDQATGDPLYDQNKNVVYYSMWVNKTEYDFITGCDFNNTTCITSAPATL